MSGLDRYVRTVLHTCRTGLDKLRVFFGTPLARRLVLGLFALQAIILVFAVGVGTPPDESTHIKFIEYYANHSWSPFLHHQTPTYNLGDKTREVDYLYHYTMSLFVRAMPFSQTVEVHVIRLCSVVVGLLTFVTLGRLLRRLGMSAAAITTSFLVLTNLPMVLMMSSAVNNDAMVWLGSALGLLLLVRLWERPTAQDFGLLIALSLFGGLVKRTLLPLGLVFVLCAGVVLLRQWRTLFRDARRHLGRTMCILLLILVGLGLFAERVGGNIVRYGTITPTCAQVQGAAACSGFWANIRAETLAQWTPEKQVPLAVFVVKWLGSSFVNVVDIQTQLWLHKVMPARFLTPALVILLAIGIGYGIRYEVRLFRTDRQARHRFYVMLILFYFLIVHMLVNYGDYRKIKFFGVALNGRYILPSLLPLVGFATYYWGQLLRRHPRVSTALAVVVVVSVIGWSGLEMMLRNTQIYSTVSK